MPKVGHNLTATPAQRPGYDTVITVTYHAGGRGPVSEHLRHPAHSSMPTTWGDLTVTPGQRPVIPQPRPPAWVRFTEQGAPTGRDNGPRTTDRFLSPDLLLVVDDSTSMVSRPFRPHLRILSQTQAVGLG